MRPLSLLVLLALSAPAVASADLPVALRVSAGAGIGAGFSGGSSTGPLGGVLAADLLVRTKPGRAWCMSYELGGAGVPGLTSLAPNQLEGIGQQTILLGLERDRSWKGISSFLLVGAGWGHIHSEFSSDWNEFTGTSEPSPNNESDGLALGGSWGIRLTPPPGPVGFIFALRSSNVMAMKAHAHTLAFTFGLTIHPQ
jgi:hypothetical protein